METVYYKWGEYRGPLNYKLEDFEIKDMMELNSNHLKGFYIREEDKDKKFYASPENVDVDESGVSVSYAIAI